MLAVVVAQAQVTLVVAEAKAVISVNLHAVAREVCNPISKRQKKRN
jgi:hypothetical protein